MKTKFSKTQVFSILIANMIGTGVFTSLGFQVAEIKSGFAIILLWVLGGLIAFLGSMCYSMLGIVLPRSGGEYNYLSRIYHPLVGFLSGWVSLVIGFAAPIAAGAFAFGAYLTNMNSIRGSVVFSHLNLSIFLIVFLTLTNIFNKRLGANTQNLYTFFKVSFILLLIGIGLNNGFTTHVSYVPDHDAFANIFSLSFVVSMYFVTYSYSGWNAICYITGEIENVERNLPKTLILGAIFVSILYILLNFVFLNAIPISQLAGQVDIGNIYASKILHSNVQQYMGIIISLLLLSSINSMIIVGPRVSMVIGEDYHPLRFLAKKNKHDVPYVAILLQSILAILYIVSFTFEQMIIYIGFVLNLFTLISVIGIFIYARANPDIVPRFRKFGYPYVPAVFIMFGTWIVVFGSIYRPLESLLGLGFTLLGAIVYFIVNWKRTSIIRVRFYGKFAALFNSGLLRVKKFLK